MVETMRRHALLMFGILAVIAMGIVLAVHAVGAHSDREEYSQKISSLESDLADAENARIEQAEEVSDEILGVDSSRLETDEKEVRSFLKLALSWDDHEEYVHARESLMRKYDLDEKSSFMTDFLPPAPSKTDSSGTQHNLIDVLGLSSEVGGAEFTVLGVEGTEYSYAVEVSVRGKSADGKGSDTMPSVILLTVDDEGGISDVHASATTSPVRSSGT